MKVQQKAFASALAAAAKVIVNRPTLPILGSILLEVDGSDLTVTATNLEQRLFLKVPVEDPTPGIACIEGKPLLKLVKSLKDVIDVQWKPGVDATEALPGLTVEGFEFVGSAGPADFPAAVIAPGSSTIPGLYAALEFCVGFSSTDASRYALNGVYIEGQEKETIVAGTDGHRLAQAWLPKADLCALIPTEALEVLFSGPLKSHRIHDMIGRDKDGVFFPLTNGYLTSRLIDGTFPKTEQVIPADSSANSILTINRDLLIEALTKAIAGSQNERNYPVNLMGDPDRGLVLNIDGTDTNIPLGTNVIPIIVGLNAKYLKWAVEVLNEKVVSIRIKDSMSPIWMSEGKMPTAKVPATWQSGKRTIVIMPMRTTATQKAEEAAKKAKAAQEEAKAS